MIVLSLILKIVWLINEQILNNHVINIAFKY
jgi:hypothetical protein